MTLKGPLVLAPGVVIFPVDQLPASVRRLARPEDRYALTRVGSRSTTKLLDEETAALLETFRRPHSIVAAVIELSRARGVDAGHLLDAAYPSVRQLVAEATLVPANTLPPDPALREGEVVGAFTIVRCVQALDGASLYQARGPDGTLVALKTGPATALVREVRVLSHLHGCRFPKVVEDGSAAPRPFLALEWLPGEVAFRYADRRRAPWRNQARAELLAAVTSLVEAYADLHHQGVIHGDVHPKNVLISGGEARLVDFSLSIVAVDGALRTTPRGGVSGSTSPNGRPKISPAARRRRPRSAVTSTRWPPPAT